MRLWMRFVVAVLLAASPVFGLSAQTTKPPVRSVAATIETTLPTAGAEIRQFAFDGDQQSFFESAQNPSSADHFTLVLDEAVSLKTVAVATGRPDGTGSLDAGSLELSPDGSAFASFVPF